MVLCQVGLAYLRANLDINCFEQKSEIRDEYAEGVIVCVTDYYAALFLSQMFL